MCKHDTLIVIGVIRRTNDDIPDGWHPKHVDSCIADKVQLMNIQGIVTSSCCCGHGERTGEILIRPESIPLLERYGYAWIWPKDDPEDDDPWWRARDDIVIVKLPLLEKTWSECDVG